MVVYNMMCVYGLCLQMTRIDSTDWRRQSTLRHSRLRGLTITGKSVR